MEQSLQQARSVFPRLCFVSDHDVKEFMAAPLKNAVNMMAANVFNTKAFDVSDNGDILGFQGEGADSGLSFKFLEAVKGGADHASTLVNLSAAMKAKVKSCMKAQLADKEWHVAAKPADIHEAVLIADEVHYCRMVEEAIPKGGLYDALDSMSEMLTKLIDFSKTEMSQACQQLTNSRLIIAVVWKRAVAKLIRSHCMNVKEQAWKQFTRFYFDGEDVTIKVGEHSMLHGYEYIGNVELLVVTQLTEQLNFAYGECLRTNKAHAALGPAGSGKTETAKDFAKKAGKFVFVCQCSDELNTADLNKMLQVLTCDDTWLVLDEFNRISKEVHEPWMADLSKFLEARSGKQNGFFITMNPGYAGRTVVYRDPKFWMENSMDKPDFLDIVQLKLATHGFHQYEDIGYRFEKARYEFRWQLPPTDHYDFGLRMVMMVIRSAGKWLVKKNVEENAAMLSALMVSVYPGLVDGHLETFAKIMDRNGFKVSEFVFPKNEKAVHPSYDAEKFQQKAAMFAEVADTRHAIQVIGHGHGFVEAIAKSYDYHMVTVDVANAVSAGYHLCKQWHKDAIDPSESKGSVSAWMFGILDTITGAWTEGEFVKALKEVVSGETSKKVGMKLLVVKLYMFDATILENLNTLMDDNKCLILANGEKIMLPKDVRIVLESKTCKVQSPATVSRCGFVFFTHE